MDILIEGHGRFNVPTAIRIAHALEGYDIHWFEEPIPPDNLEALAEVKQRTRVPIAAGERLCIAAGISALLRTPLRRFRTARREPHRWHHGGEENRRAGRGQPPRHLPAQPA